MHRLLPLSLTALLAACGAPAPETVAAAGPPGRTNIGIHGAWTLEVHDPDGSLVERRAFHNDYADNDVLPQILTRRLTTGHWRVVLAGPQPGFQSPCNTGTGAQNCILTEAGSVNPESFPLGTTYGDSLFTLAGSATALTNGEIEQVATNLTWCDPNVAPDACAGGVDSVLFTTTSLSPPLSMQENQSVYVAVEISFATLP